MRRINGGMNMDMDRAVGGIFKGAGVIVVIVFCIICLGIALIVPCCNYVREKGLRNIGQSLMDGSENTTNSTERTSE